jgi:hypothetical protein
LVGKSAFFTANNAMQANIRKEIMDTFQSPHSEKVTKAASIPIITRIEPSI